MRGATPAGARDEREAARWVRDMFGRVAHRYDLLNHLLSFNIDRYWRARTARLLSAQLSRPGVRALDLCCGTGDLARAFNPYCTCVHAADFSHPMLRAARRKGLSLLIEADALELPLPDASFDVVAAAFGFRNLANYRAGLEEMRRVLRPDGTAAILEFSQPPNPAFAALYNLYSRRLLPALGGLISGSREAYAYLPESVGRFPKAEDLAAQMRQAGFRGVRFLRMTGGIVALHLGER